MITKEQVLNTVIQLRKNSRRTLTKIAKNTGLPVSTVYEYLKSNKINANKYTILLDFRKYGFHCCLCMLFKSNTESRGVMLEFLKNNNNINNLYKLHNKYDFMVELLFKDIKDADVFVEEFTSKFGIKNYTTCFIVEELEREKFMSNKHHVMMCLED